MWCQWYRRWLMPPVAAVLPKLIAPLGRFAGLVARLSGPSRVFRSPVTPAANAQVHIGVRPNFQDRFRQLSQYINAFRYARPSCASRNCIRTTSLYGLHHIAAPRSERTTAAVLRPAASQLCPWFPPPLNARYRCCHTPGKAAWSALVAGCAGPFFSRGSGFLS